MKKLDGHKSMQNRKNLTNSIRGQLTIFIILMSIVVSSYVLAIKYRENRKAEELYYHGYCSGGEYVRTIDCAPIIDKNGVDSKYKIEFEDKQSNYLIYAPFTQPDDNKNYLANLTLADLAYEERKYDEALTYYKSAKKLNKKESLPSVGIAKSYLASSRLCSARFLQVAFTLQNWQ